jgi:hypothetical protein
LKKIITLFIAVALIATLGVSAIAGAGEDAFANAVIDENAQFAYEKAAAEFAQGNDVEGVAAEENAENTLAKSSLPFLNFMGAVNSAHYVRAFKGRVPPGSNYISLPKGYRVTEVPGGMQVIVKYQYAVWDSTRGAYVFPATQD